MDLISKFNVVHNINLQDFADKLNFRWTPLILILCATVISIKQYLMRPLACYISHQVGGNGIDAYVENFCWIHGTYPIALNTQISHLQHSWNELNAIKVSYYQWIPFILGLQTILFTVPQLFWSMFIYNRTGVDLEQLIILASKAVNNVGKLRKNVVKHIVNVLDDMINCHRDYRTGKFATYRRRLASCCFFFVPSKRLGSWLFLFYLFIKMLSIINVVGQIFLMQTFLQMGNNYTHFGYDILRDVIKGRDWQESLVFPRVTYCRVFLRHLSSNNNLFVQCTLPVNMISEKIYIFLWWYFIFVAILTSCSFLKWITLSSQKAALCFTKRLLKTGRLYGDGDNKIILHDFVRDFLQKDGLFLMRMFECNVGDIVTIRIACHLFKVYKNKRQNLNEP